jgi:hypothetical protein
MDGQQIRSTEKSRVDKFFNGAYLVALVIGVIASAVAISTRNRLQRAKDEVRLEILEIQRRRMAEKEDLNPTSTSP